MMPDALLAARPEVSRAVSRIMSGAHFTGLLLDNKQQRAAALEAVLDQVNDSTTRVVWVGNPLRSPLTVERFLIQIAGPEVDLRIDRSPAQLAKLITEPLGDESRLLVVVQQPETMGAEARDILGAIPAHLSSEALQVQFLFVGPTTFTMLNEPGALVPAPTPVAPKRKPLLTRLYVVLPVSLLLGAALGVGGTFAVFHTRAQLLEAIGRALPAAVAPPASQSVASSARPGEAAPIPVPVPAPIPVPAAAAKPAPAPPPGPDLAELRREFDAFLAKRTAITPPMTEAQKDALFQEFLAQRRHN